MLENGSPSMRHQLGGQVRHEIRDVSDALAFGDERKSQIHVTHLPDRRERIAQAIAAGTSRHFIEIRRHERQRAQRRLRIAPQRLASSDDRAAIISRRVSEKHGWKAKYSGMVCCNGPKPSSQRPSDTP